MIDAAASQYETHVSRLSDTESARFEVRFIGDGESVTVECVGPEPDGEGHEREDVVRSAIAVLRRIVDADAAATPSAADADVSHAPPRSL